MVLPKHWTRFQVRRFGLNRPPFSRGLADPPRRQAEEGHPGPGAGPDGADEDWDLLVMTPLDLGEEAGANDDPPVSHVRSTAGGYVNFWTIEEWNAREAQRAATLPKRRATRRRRAGTGGLGSEKRRRAWKRGGGGQRARGPSGRFI